MKIEKEKDEKIEKEIRELRKERNKGRLIPEKNTNLSKRRKIDEEQYISIRKYGALHHQRPPGRTLPRMTA